MTLNATADISIQDSSICYLNDESSNLNDKSLINEQVETFLTNNDNLDQKSITETAKHEQYDLQMEIDNVSINCSTNNNQSTNDEDSSIQKSIDSVLEESSIHESINSVLEENDKIISKTKKKDNYSESSKKRTKLTPKKEDTMTSSLKSPPLIRQAKLQINDKTLKKLRSDTDDLIFEEDSTNGNSDLKQKFQLNNESKLKNKNLLMPVVNNVLSRSIAAIFRNSTISKNGEFNSYSALGFNKGPRVKRVCRTFSDVYRGAPRAVFPLPSNSNNSNKINKSSNNSPNKRSKSKKIKNNKSSTSASQQSSASTSKSNSNSSFKEDDSTEYSPYDSDDLSITEYIERNLKREMETSSN